jgi:hypothetical protein
MDKKAAVAVRTAIAFTMAVLAVSIFCTVLWIISRPEPVYPWEMQEAFGSFLGAICMLSGLGLGVYHLVDWLLSPRLGKEIL